jgi:hypothetical protein
VVGIEVSAIAFKPSDSTAALTLLYASGWLAATMSEPAGTSASPDLNDSSFAWTFRPFSLNRSVIRLFYP